MGGIDKDFELNRDKFIASTWIEFEHNGEKTQYRVLGTGTTKDGRCRSSYTLYIDYRFHPSIITKYSQNKRRFI